MTMPPGILTVTLTGRYVHPDGSPLSGKVTISTPALLTLSGADTIAAGSATFTLDENGAFSAVLVATDNPDMQPTEWKYQVIEQFNGNLNRTYWIDLPSTLSPVDLADIAPGDPARGTYVLVPGPQGTQGTPGASGNTILSGHGTPSAGTGANGDFWMDLDAWALYGPKAGGSWPGTGLPITDVIQSVNGKTGVVNLTAADVAADPAGAAATAQSAAAADATSKVSAHASGTDPHGDRAWATGSFLPLTGGTVTTDLTVAGRLTASGWALPMLAPSGRRPRWRPASWQQIFTAGHGWTTSGSGAASSSDDTSLFCKGSQSLAMTTTGTGAVANLRRYGAPAIDLTGKAIRVTFRISDVSKLNQLNFLAGTSSLANSYSWRLLTYASTAQNQVQSGEWVTVTLQWAGVRSPTGTYTVGSTGIPSTTSGITDMAFQVVDNGTGPATVNLQSVEIIPDTTTTFPGGAVSITFDDCYSTVWSNARPKMDALGYRGTIYAIADVVTDTPGTYLTKTNLRSMQDQSGWEIAGHAYTAAAHNAKYTTLSTRAVLDELRNLRSWMVDAGFQSEHFAYPGGWFGPTTDGDPIDRLTAKFFTSGRGISSADNAGETFPPGMPYRMRSVSGIGGMAGAASPAYPSTLLSAGGAMDRCAYDGSWLILTFHEITSGAATTTNQCSLTDFNSIMDGIAARGIQVLPVSDAMRYYS